MKGIRAYNMRYENLHMLAFFLGFILDLILGDPYTLPHPVRLIGKLITATEKILCRKTAHDYHGYHNYHRSELKQGLQLVLIVLISIAAASFFLLAISYQLHPMLGMTVESIMTYQILAVKCLKTESMKVYQCLKDGSLTQARKAVSMIVGRDTEHLDEEGIIKAAVETVEENTSDGVVAPMLYLAIGGPVLGFLYKTVNTMDSMIGYKNDKYLYLGRAAAKLDDFMNFLPAKISACLMIAASFFAGSQYSGTGAWAIYKRDRKKHASPNAGQTEAACAGALSIRLAGDASYFGKTVKKPYIGEAARKAEYEDIKRVLTEDVDLLFLANPNNPIGKLLDPQQVKQLLQHCREQGIYVAVDECFIEFCGNQFSLLPEALEFEHLILVRAFTKIFSIPGVRLGYLVCKNKAVRRGADHKTGHTYQRGF